MDEDEVMISFDVVSLFTNTPVDLALNQTEMLLINDNTLSERTNLDVPEIMLGIRLCVNNMFFSANDKIYQQIQGLPMGSNLSPVLANIAMQYIETTALSTFNNSVKLWKRYVDDTFVLIKK